MAGVCRCEAEQASGDRGNRDDNDTGDRDHRARFCLHWSFCSGGHRFPGRARNGFIGRLLWGRRPVRSDHGRGTDHCTGSLRDRHRLLCKAGRYGKKNERNAGNRPPGCKGIFVCRDLMLSWGSRIGNLSAYVTGRTGYIRLPEQRGHGYGRHLLRNAAQTVPQ